MPSPRVLVTGFGRFPGAPSNPSGPLALAVAGSRRLAGRGIEALVLPTTWEDAARFPATLRRLDPDIVVMIGLAGRRRQVCIELVGRNGGGSFPDATRKRPGTRRAEAGGPALRGSTADAAPLLRALRQAGIPARASRDAGRYICNALAFRAYGWAQATQPRRLAVFVHIPYPRAIGRPPSALARGFEALILALAAQHRTARFTAAAAR